MTIKTTIRGGAKISEKMNKLVVDFLMKKVNPLYLEAYDTLVTLEYPINDYESLKKQLATNENKDSEKLIRLVLGVTDMPLSSPQSGMEKFHARLFALLDYGRGYEDPRKIPGVPVPDIPEGSPTLPPPKYMVSVCAHSARTTADKCCVRGTREWAIVYLETFFGCIKSVLGPGRLSIPSPEDFMSPR